jgi:hypothetical protein
MSYEARDNVTRCAKCLRDASTCGMMHLWDGKDYCETCVQTASPLLAVAGSGSARLLEKITLAPREAIRDELTYWLFTGPLIIGFFVYCGITNGAGAIAGGFVGALSVVAAAVLRCVGVARRARQVHGTVAVENGSLIVWHPSLGRATWALRDCVWRYGKVHESTLFFSRLHLRRQIIIVEGPLTDGLFCRTRQSVACGLTTESRQVWEGFLKLAGVRYKSHR